MRVRERAGDELRRDRRIRALGSEHGDDPAGAVGVVEREPALEAGAEDRDVDPPRARLRGDGAQIEERAEQDLLAALRRGEDRAGPVRGREDQRVGARLEELPRRRPDVEAVDPCRVPLPADDRALELAAAIAARPRSRRSRARAGSRTRAPAESSRSRAGRRRRSRAAPRLLRPGVKATWTRMATGTLAGTWRPVIAIPIGRPAFRARSAGGRSAPIA